MHNLLSEWIDDQIAGYDFFGALTVLKVEECKRFVLAVCVFLCVHVFH